MCRAKFIQNIYPVGENPTRGKVMGYRAAMQVKRLSLALLSALSLTIASHKGKLYISCGYDTNMEDIPKLSEKVKVV